MRHLLLDLPALLLACGRVPRIGDRFPVELTPIVIDRAPVRRLP